MTQEDCISAQNITKSIDGFLLDHATFRIPIGGNVVFVGEEQSGKTLLLRCILGLTALDSGKITTKLPLISFLAKTGVVLGDSSLPLHFTPKQVATVFSPHFPSWNQEKYENTLKKLNISYKIPLSTVETAQECLFATALAHSPTLFVHDRPSSSTTSSLEMSEWRERELHCLSLLEEEEMLPREIPLTKIHTRQNVEELPPSVTHLGFLHQGVLLLFGERMKLLDQCALVRCTYPQFEHIEPRHYIKAIESPQEVTLLISDRFDFFLHYPQFPFENITIPQLCNLIQEGVST